MMRALMLALAWLCLLATPAQARVPAADWVTVWAASPMTVDGNQGVDAALKPGVIVRQTVRSTAAGSRLRLRLTNRYGDAPLTVEAVRIGLAPGAGAPALRAETARTVQFGGATRITIPAGADAVSDPLALDVAAAAHLGIEFVVRDLPGRVTGHPGARTRSFIASGPDAGGTAVDAWLFLGGVDVFTRAPGAVAILGDSITDGYGVVPDSDGRWPDRLYDRLRTARRDAPAVLNLGIGGNRLLADCLGPNALARIEREMAAISGLRTLIVLIGVNDLGTLTRERPASADAHRQLRDNMIAGYGQLVARGRARGIRMIGATIMPFAGSGYYHPDAANEADRAAVNAFIRAPGSFDAVIDFDAITRDPARPLHLRADVDNGDGLHPSMQGYRIMADAVPIDLVAPAPGQPVIVLTFDDLPLHRPQVAAMPPLAIARSITATLRARGVTDAYGFVNGADVAADPALGSALRVWRDAGYRLANHGWQHLDLNRMPDDAVTPELVRNEALLARLMPGEDWHWFRYPFLVEGDQAPRRDRMRALLAQRGYRIAPVSLDFGDWRFGEPYARCVARGDDVAVAWLEDQFLASADRALVRDRAIGTALAGRDVPMVALLHAGAFTARVLPALLHRIEASGLRYGTLDQAIADPVFAAAANPSRPFEPSTLAMRAPPTEDAEERALGERLATLCR